LEFIDHGICQKEFTSEGAQRESSRLELSESNVKHVGPHNEGGAEYDQLNSAEYITKKHGRSQKRPFVGSEDEWSEEEPQISKRAHERGSVEDDGTSTRMSNCTNETDPDPSDNSHLSVGKISSQAHSTNVHTKAIDGPTNTVVEVGAPQKHRIVRAGNTNANDGSPNPSGLEVAPHMQRIFRAENLSPSAKDDHSDMSVSKRVPPKQRKTRLSSHASESRSGSEKSRPPTLNGKKTKSKMVTKSTSPLHDSNSDSTASLVDSDGDLTEDGSTVSNSKADGKRTAFASASQIEALCQIRFPNDKLTVSYVEGDGNCMFRTISLALYGSQDHHGVVREAVILMIAMFPHIFFEMAELEEDQSFQDYLATMLIDGEYANTVESAAAQMLYGYSQETLMLSRTSESWAPASPGGGFTLIEAHVTAPRPKDNHYWHVHTSHQPKRGWFQGIVPGVIEREALSEFGLLAECLCKENLIPAGPHGDLSWPTTKHWDFLPKLEDWPGSPNSVSYPSMYIVTEWKQNMVKYPFLMSSVVSPMFEIAKSLKGSPSSIIQDAMMKEFATSFMSNYTFQCDRQQGEGAQQGHVDYLYPLLRIWVLMVYRYFSIFLCSQEASLRLWKEGLPPWLLHPKRPQLLLIRRLPSGHHPEHTLKLLPFSLSNQGSG